MKRLQLLYTLLDREQKRRDEVKTILGNAFANLEAQQKQVDGLKAYRAEYCAKWSGNFRQSATIEILRSYHGFLARLDQAVAQQGNVVAHAQRAVDAAKARLLQKEIRVKTVERLIERRKAMLARVADRRDQKNLDEMAARHARSKELAGMA